MSVLTSELALLRTKSVGSASSTRRNIARRIDWVPRLAAQASPYCEMKPAAPRIVVRPTTAIGTSQSGNALLVMPSSSSTLRSAGIAGSVAAAMSAPTTASTKPRRQSAK